MVSLSNQEAGTAGCPDLVLRRAQDEVFMRGMHKANPEPFKAFQRCIQIRHHSRFGEE